MSMLLFVECGLNILVEINFYLPLQLPSTSVPPLVRNTESKLLKSKRKCFVCGNDSLKFPKYTFFGLPKDETRYYFLSFIVNEFFDPPNKLLHTPKKFSGVLPPHSEKTYFSFDPKQLANKDCVWQSVILHRPYAS